MDRTEKLVNDVAHMQGSVYDVQGEFLVFRERIAKLERTTRFLTIVVVGLVLIVLLGDKAWTLNES